MEAYHSGARYSDTHSVLEDVAADFHLEDISRSESPIRVGRGTSVFNDLHCLCDCKGYGDWLCASERWLDFLSDQFDDF